MAVEHEVDDGDSREGSPDWLRAFQAPNRDLVMLSCSDSSPGSSPRRTGQVSREERKKGKEKADSDRISISEDDSPIKGKKPKAARTRTRTNQIEDSLEHQEGEHAKEGIQDKPTAHSVSQRLPLVFPDKVQRSKALIECHGDSIDLSGDVGAVGRIVISDGPSGNQELLLDLKGTIYKSTIVPSRTFCVVSVGQSEAKLEAIMNDFIQLEPQSNLLEAETMIEGTLDGFSFDSDEEGDKVPESAGHQNDQNNENEGQPKAKTKRKSEKAVGTGKKAKIAGRPSKKGPKRTQTAKKTKRTKK